MKKVLGFLLATSVALGSFSALAADESTFKDISDAKYAWAKPYIEEMAKGGYIAGYEDNTYRPDNMVTKLETIVLFSRAMGAKKSTNADAVELALDKYSKVILRFITAREPGSIFKESSLYSFSPISLSDSTEDIRLIRILVFSVYSTVPEVKTRLRILCVFSLSKRYICSISLDVKPLCDSRILISGFCITYFLSVSIFFIFAPRIYKYILTHPHVFCNTLHFNFYLYLHREILALFLVFDLT